MIDKPRIVQSSAQHTATIRLTVPRAEIQNVMGPAITEVMATVASQGVRPTGPVFSYHFRLDSQVFDFEVGVPVPASITASGRVKPSSLPATTVARTVYRGPYEGLGAAWGMFLAEITAAGHERGDQFWESYVSGPESSMDPNAWATELNWTLCRTA